MCFYNDEHQPVNDGEARAMTLGGIQWNWLPNQLGHAVFTQNPVYVARLQTERGDALRVWEFDRWNGTTWQLDLHLVVVLKLPHRLGVWADEDVYAMPARFEVGSKPDPGKEA